jgi:hypothetical protein
MMTRSRGTRYASGQITPRTSASLRETEEGSMVREGFRKVRDLLMSLWYFIHQQPLTPPAALKDQLSGMPETQAQRLLRRWKQSRARSRA